MESTLIFIENMMLIIWLEGGGGGGGISIG